MRVVTVPALSELINKVGVIEFIAKVRDRIEYDFNRWDEFEKIPRPASHFSTGVIEVMPTCDKDNYAFKYVNGHPANTASGKFCVAAIGLLAETKSGYPLLMSEMTILTAIRTAATSALAAKYVSRKDSKVHSIIGTGAQAEFQILAMNDVRPIEKTYCFDIDPKAMEKTKDNLSKYDIDLVLCSEMKEVFVECDILTTATAVKKDNVLFGSGEVSDGTHLNALGGDCPGKTELPDDLVRKAAVCVELMEQSQIEGEIQILKDTSNVFELQEVIRGKHPGRASSDQITLFDSVGFAIEDFSTLMVVNDLCIEHSLGEDIDLIPAPSDPKNLFAEI